MFNLNCVLGLKLEIEIEPEFKKNMVNTSHDKTVST